MIQRLSKLPIRKKLLVITMVTSCLALSLAASGFIAYEAATFRLYAAQRLQLLSEVIGAESRVAVERGEVGLRFGERR